MAGGVGVVGEERRGEKEERKCLIFASRISERDGSRLKKKISG